MDDGPMETVKYMWVNIWCMLEWIVGLAEIHFLAQLVSAQNEVLLSGWQG